MNVSFFVLKIKFASCLKCVFKPCIESDHGVLVARSLIVQEDEAGSLSRV